MPRLPWHRVFHPLCGADPLTLLRLLARAGPPGLRGALPFGLAAAASLARLPFTLAERAWTAAVPAAEAAAPVFILGFPRSGTTHLHNVLAATGCFATVPPVLAGMPWEARGLAPVLRPFINPYLPETRVIDGMRLDANSPTEDEVALANMAPLSYFHAIYFPRRFRAAFREGLLFEGARAAEVDARGRALRRYVAAMGRRGPLLLKNPAYTAQIPWLLELFPGARVIHIHRDPLAVFASNRRALRVVLAELALQPWAEGDVDEAILETYPAVMERLLAARAALPEARFAEVSFEALTRAPLDAVRQLGRALGLAGVEAQIPRVERYLRLVASYRALGEGLSGREATAVSRRWRPLLEIYGDKRPAISAE